MVSARSNKSDNISNHDNIKILDPDLKVPNAKNQGQGPGRFRFLVDPSPKLSTAAFLKIISGVGGQLLKH